MTGGEVGYTGCDGTCTPPGSRNGRARAFVPPAHVDGDGVAVGPLRNRRRRVAAHGAGNARPAARAARPDGRPHRAVHAALGRGRSDEAGGSARPVGSRVRLDAVRRGARRAACPRHHHGPHDLGRSRLGERKPSAELAPADRSRRLRLRRIEALPVGAPLDDLERAEQPTVRRPCLPRALRSRCAQPGVRIAPSRELGERRRRRRHLAAQDAERAGADDVHDRDAGGPRPARRVRRQSVPGIVARDARPSTPAARATR